MSEYNVNINKIYWLDTENPEAEILFEIDGKQFWAFCHPCDFIEGEIVNVKLSFIEEEISDIAFWNINKEKGKKIVPSGNRCSYQCYGQIKQIHPLIIDCGSLVLSFGDWIDDIKAIGYYVYFVISRLDIERVGSE